MGAASSTPGSSRPQRWVRPSKPFNTRSWGVEAGRRRSGQAVASASPRPPPLPNDVSAALATISSGHHGGPPGANTVEALRTAWEADQATLLVAVRALTAVVTGVGAADGGVGPHAPTTTTTAEADDRLPPDAAAWLASHDPDARAVLAALARGRTAAAAAAQARLCERQGVSVRALAGRAAVLGWDAALLARRAATLGTLLDAADTAMAGSGGWTRLVDQGAAGLTIDYRTVRPPAGEAGPTLHALVMNDVFPAGVAALLALTREADLVKAWNPFCTVAEVVEVGGGRPGWTRVGYAAMRMMPGLPNFDVLARGVGHDLGEERRALAMTLAQPTPDEADAPPSTPAVRHPAEPASAAGCHRVSLHAGSGFIFTPVAPDPGAPGAARSLGTLCVAMHLRLPFVPPVLVRWAVQFLLPLLARSLKKHLVGPWFQRSAPAAGAAAGGGGGAAAVAEPASTPPPGAWSTGVAALRRAAAAAAPPRDRRPRADAVGLFADRIAASFTYRRLEDRVREVGEGVPGGWPAGRPEWEAWWREAVLGRRCG